MKLDEWGNVIVSWASFLDPNEKILSVDELARSNLFVRLLNVLENSQCQDVGDSNELYRFLQVHYNSLDLGELISECKENTILRATAFLIYCSLHHEENDIQKKMIDLPGWTQLCLTDFLKELVNVSKKDITRELIFSNISKLGVCRILESLNETPPSVTYTTSPSTDECSQKSSSKKPSRVQKLKNEIEMLHILKSELTEELEATKVSVLKLESTVARKDQEMKRMWLDLVNAENMAEVREEQPTSNVDTIQMEKLQGRIRRLEEETENLRFDLEQAFKEKESAYHEVQKLKSSLKEGEFARRIYDSDRSQLENEIERLQDAIKDLEATNKEQSDYIGELVRGKDDSKIYSDSQDSSLLLPESLGEHVIDLEVQELKDVILNKENEIENIKSKLKEMEDKYVSTSEGFITKEKKYLSDIESLSGTIKSTEEDLRNMECQNIYMSNTLREKESIVVSMQSSLDLLDEELVCLRKTENSLSMEIQRKDGYNQELLAEMDALADVIKDYTREKDFLIKSLTEKETQLHQSFANLQQLQLEFDTQVKGLHRDLEAKTQEYRIVESEMLQLRSALDYYTGELASFQSRVRDQEEEILSNINIIGKLESDIENYKILENNMKSAMHNLEIKMKGINDELVTASSERNSLLTKKVELEKEVSLNLEQIGSLKAELDQNQTNLQERQEEILNHVNIIGKLESDIENYIISENNMKSAMHNLEIKMKGINDELVTVSSERNSLLTGKIELEKEVSLNLEQIGSLKAELDQNQTNLQEREEEILNHVNIIGKLESDIEQRKLTEINLKSEINNLEIKMKGINDELDTASSERNSLLTEKIELEKEVSLNLEQIGSLKAELDQNQINLQEREEEILNHVNFIGKLESDIEQRKLTEINLKSEINNLEIKMKGINDELDTASSERNSLLTEKIELEKEVSLNLEQIGSLKAELDQNQINLQKREEEVLNHVNIIGKLESDIEQRKLTEINLKSEINNLKSEIERVNDELTLKISFVTDLEQQLSSVSLEKNILQTKNTELEKDISRNLEQIESLKAELDQNEINLQEREEEILSNNNIIGKMESDIDQYKITGINMKSEINKLESQIMGVNDELAIKVSFITDLENQLSSASSEKISLDTKKIELEKAVSVNLEQIRSLRAELDQNKTNLQEREGEILNKIDIIGKLESDIEHYKLTENIMKTEVTNLESKIIGVTDELALKISCITDLEDKLSKASSEKNSLETKKIELEKEISVNLDLIVSLNAELHRNGTKLQEREEEILDNMKTIAKMVSDVEHYKITENNMKSEINNLESKIKETNDELVSASSERNSLLTKQIELEREASENLEQIGSLKAELDRNQIKLQEREEEVINHVNIIGKLESDIEHYKITENNMKTEINHLKSKIKEMDDELVLKISLVSDLEKQLSLVSSEKNILETKKIELETEISVNLEQIGSLNAALEHKEEEIKCRDVQKTKEQLEFNTIIDELKSSVRELNSTNDKLESEKMSFEEERSGLISSYNEKLDLLRNDVNTLNTDNRNLCQELSSREDTISQLKGDIMSCKSLEDVLKSENDFLQSEIKDISGTLRTVQLDHSSCNGKIQSLESKICELRDEILKMEIRDQILKKELKKYMEREVSLKAELESKLCDIYELRGQLRSLDKLVSDRDFDKGILISKLQAKEAELNQMKLDLGETNKQMALRDERNKDEINLHIKKIHDLDNTIGKLNNQFVKVNREKEALILKLDEKESILRDLGGLKSECECLRGENEMLVKEATDKSVMIAQLRGELVRSEEGVQAARSAGDLLQEQLNSKTNELQRLTQELTSLQSNAQQKQINANDLIKQILLKDNLISDLENQISLYSKSAEEISALKESLSNKSEIIENYTKEKKKLMMNLELSSKKEDLVNSQLEIKVKEVEDMQSQLAQAESEISKLKVTSSEQDETTRSLYVTLQSQNSEMKEKDSEITKLQSEIKTLHQIMISEKDKTNQLDTLPKIEKAVSNSENGEGSILFTEKEVEQKLQEMKTVYEKKIELYKTTVKKRFAEKLEDLTHTLQNENIDIKEKALKEQERCAKLQSELWNASDKLLIAQERNRSLLIKLQGRNTFEVARPTEPLSPISKARSMEVLSGRNRGIDNFARDISPNEPGSSSSRRSSIRSLPRGMGKKFSFSTGKVFPAAEEDGEVFDNRNLADLKAGVCNIPIEEDRMSTLQYRNSLCPPHLKSSYPAETQFFNHHKEDDIKCGSWLYPASSESDLRKVKVQSTYKKPGPPTPSKNGAQGRLSFQGNERSCPQPSKAPLNVTSMSEGVVNESFVLKETTNRRELPPPRAPKVSTPSRLKALFTPSRRDENSPKRKSTFLRRN